MIIALVIVSGVCVYLGYRVLYLKQELEECCDAYELELCKCDRELVKYYELLEKEKGVKD